MATAYVLHVWVSVVSWRIVHTLPPFPSSISIGTAFNSFGVPAGLTEAVYMIAGYKSASDASNLVGVIMTPVLQVKKKQ